MRKSGKTEPAPAVRIEKAFRAGAASATGEDPRWERVLARDASADGEFYYSVMSTGVYCRPSCASKLAKREQVEFHATQGDARRAGFRPCKRCKPEQLTGGAQDSDICYAVGESSLGSVLVARRSGGICAILMGDDPDAVARELRGRFPGATLRGGHGPEFEKVAALAVGLVEGRADAAELPLDLPGTAFQRRVWQEVRRIPPGATASYADIAARIRAPKAVRAVAQACAANVMAVAVPCHRVVRGDGGLSGYRWGTERKRALLAREAGA